MQVGLMSNTENYTNFKAQQRYEGPFGKINFGQYKFEEYPKQITLVDDNDRKTVVVVHSRAEELALSDRKAPAQDVAQANAETAALQRQMNEMAVELAALRAERAAAAEAKISNVPVTGRNTERK